MTEFFEKYIDCLKKNDGYKTWRHRLYKYRNGFDSYERHLMAATFLNCLDVRQTLDVGGLKGKIKYFLDNPDRSVTVANLSGDVDILYEGDSLPVDDSSFEAVVTLDVLEHVPPEKRLNFLKDIVRACRRFLFLSVPYRTDKHVQSEQELLKLYREITKKDHHFLSEHVKNGLVNEEDISGYLDKISDDLPIKNYEFLFTGNCLEVARPVELSLQAKSLGYFSFLFSYPWIYSEKVGWSKNIDWSQKPSVTTNRLYLLLEKDQDSPE